MIREKPGILQSCLLAIVVVPCMAAASDLGGVWSAVVAPESGAINRALIVDAGDRIYFHYLCDGAHRCEVFGLAQKRSSSSSEHYVFRNDEKHHLYAGYEGYGFEENGDCEVTFSLEGDVLKVRATGNCASFCGMRAGIGGDLRKVPESNLALHSSSASAP